MCVLDNIKLGSKGGGCANCYSGSVSKILLFISTLGKGLTSLRRVFASKESFAFSSQRWQIYRDKYIRLFIYLCACREDDGISRKRKKNAVYIQKNTNWKPFYSAGNAIVQD